MDKKLFYYHLPKDLIALHPANRRDESALLFLEGNTGEIEDLEFADLISLLEPGDCLVLNDTKVMPARLEGKIEPGGSKAEVLLLEKKEGDIWECLVRPGKKLRAGRKLTFKEGLLKGQVEKVLENGNRLISFSYSGDWDRLVDKIGEMPLPPYIEREAQKVDKTRYQTVYARKSGSSAAPTAGLHFTPELLDKIEEKGVKLAYLTLHVGLGTFRPVKADKIEDHVMHSEYYSLNVQTAQLINDCRSKGGRVIAVGTTSCRVLESLADEKGHIKAASGYTDIFIYPGYKFKITDALVTNFHLPESTLLMLVSAFVGRESVLRAYEHAIEKKYRFFSYGDAMFLTRRKDD